MDLVKLTEDLVKSVVKDEDGVSAKEFSTDDENKVLIQVMISESDMEYLGDSAGKVLNAIKTLVRTAASMNGITKFINIDIDTF